MIEFEICTLAEDLKYLLGEGYKNNENISPNQAELWPQNRIIKKELLGINIENALRLLEEDGWNNETVGDSSKDLAKRYFWEKERHWPRTPVIIRLSRFLGLDFYQTLVLVLKGQWEKFYLDKKVDNSEKDDIVFESVLCLLKDDIEGQINEFNLGYTGKFSYAQKGHNENVEPGNEEVFKLLTEYGYPAEEKIDFVQFENIINAVILSKKFLAGINTDTLGNYLEGLKKEISALQNGKPEENEDFWLAKCLYLQKTNELGQILMNIETNRIQNANTTNEWYKEFGELMVQLVEIENEILLLNKKIELKEINPNIKEDELESMLKEIEDNLKEKLEKEKSELSEVNWENIEATKMEGETLVSYNQQAKEMLNKIFWHSHPDSHYVVSMGFSEKQKAALQKYYEDSIKIKKQEKGNYTARTLTLITDIWSSLKYLYTKLGYNVEDEVKIEGNTIAEMTDNLSKLTNMINEEISKMKDELLLMINNSDINEKKACLNPKETIETIKDSFNKKIIEKKKEQGILQKQWEKL